MIRTVILLITTVVVVPVVAFYFGEALTVLQVDILRKLAFVAFAAAMYSFVVSELSKNYSQTDKLWSLMPIVYAWLATSWAGWNSRMIFLSVLVTIWGLRLTYNFMRRGGYSLLIWEGEEDYRWAILRSKPPLNVAWKFSLFNLFFISLYQHALILMFTLPIVLSTSTTSLTVVDYVLGAILIFLVWFEWKADEEQYRFQSEKHRLMNEGTELKAPYKKGFVDSGLWGLMRHPNYFAEQTIWIVFYGFSVVATGLPINWSIIGCLLLVVLFNSSANFSEEISASKYPDYQNYQKRVGRFIPKFPLSKKEA